MDTVIQRVLEGSILEGVSGGGHASNVDCSSSPVHLKPEPSDLWFLQYLGLMLTNQLGVPLADHVLKVDVQLDVGF